MLEGRLITGDQREFVLAEWDGANRSGFDPLDDKCLVLMDEHTAVTSGGIALPEQVTERQSKASETGILVALGPAAFVWNDEATREWRGRKPEAGDRIYIERYAGQLLQGADGRVYRLLSQRCIGAVANATLREVANGGSLRGAGGRKTKPGSGAGDAVPPTVSATQRGRNRAARRDQGQGRGAGAAV